MTGPSLRPRRLFWRPSDTFGFGWRRPVRLDLVESEFQIGWRVLVVCRVDLLDELNSASAAATTVREQIDRGMAALETEIAKRLGAVGDQPRISRSKADHHEK